MLKSKITFFIAVLFWINSLSAYTLRPPATVNVTDWHSVEAYLQQQGIQAEEVEEVHLTSLGLTEIPSWVFDKTHNIETLNLSNNAIEDVPEGVGNLGNLYYLGLKNNGIQSIHPNIQNATNLFRIDVSGNKLTKIPLGIYRLRWLKDFKASENAIQEITSDIGGMEELVALNVSGNPFKALPKEISRLSKLKRFYAAKTHLARLPKEIEHLKGHITRIDLEGIKNFAETDKDDELGKTSLTKFFDDKVKF